MTLFPGVHTVGSPVRGPVRRRGVHDGGGPGDALQDREAAEEEVRHRQPGVAAHHPAGLLQAEVR